MSTFRKIVSDGIQLQRSTFKSLHEFNFKELRYHESQKSYTFYMSNFGYGRYVAIPFDHKRIKRHYCAKYIFDGSYIFCDIFEVTNKGSYDYFDLLSYLSICIYVLNRLKKTSFQTVRVGFCLNDEEKEEPVHTCNDKNGCVFSAKHVNNGVTTFTDGRPEGIYIYRIQDLKKVLIHELIHFYSLDFKSKRLFLDHRFADSYCIKDVAGRIDINEAYTEALACFVYIVIHINMSEDGARMDDRIYHNELCKSVRRARNEFMYKIAGILQRHTDIVKGTCQINLIQDTHVFSYYLCKSALFYQIHSFLALVKDGPHEGQFKRLLSDVLSSDFFKKCMRRKLPKVDRLLNRMEMSPNMATKAS